MKSCPTCHSTHPSNYAVCPQDGTVLVEVEAWSDGTVIRGKYRILNKVGQGGMGAVYKALHLAFDEVRALKVISGELMRDDLFVKRFKHEAVITRKLQHPNAVRVDDIDEAEDGRPYIVMEFIEGRSLKKLIQEEGPLPASRICPIIKQSAAALEAAHQLGMVHRDIKPENIVLVETLQGEQAKVLDFGIAKVKEARMGGTAGMTLTGTGVVIGTPQYMSPEQAMGKRGDELDGRSDIYSLGIVMYQMLTAELPFRAETTMEMLLAHMQRAPTPIQTSHPELKIPEALSNLVMKCLEKKRELRPASAKALIEEIEHVEKQPGRAVPSQTLRQTIVASADMLQVPAPPVPSPAARPPVARPLVEQPNVEPLAPPPHLAPKPAPKPIPPPAPVRPPAPAPAPLQVPAHMPGPSSSPVPRRESRWGLWAAVAILVIGLGVGGYAIWGPKPVKEGTISGTIKDQRGNVVAGASITAMRHSTGEAVGDAGSGTVGQYTILHLEPGSYDLKAEAAGFKPRIIASVVVSAGHESNWDFDLERAGSPNPGPVVPNIDRQKVADAIRQGDDYHNRGEYEAAIRAYQEGLSADPSDQTLQSKIARSRKAKAAEDRLNR